MRALLLFACLVSAGPAAAQGVDVIGEVRVHGNHTTPDADILAIAGLQAGAAAGDAALAQARRRLIDSGRFAGVEVRKRMRSIDDPTDILVIIVVDEVIGITSEDLTPGPLKKVRSAGMWLPVLDYQEGYGWTYGARVSFVGALGGRSRVSVPLTWGGERRVALEADRTFERGPLTRIEGAVSFERQVNPHFDASDARKSAQLRAERAITRWLRVGAGARVEQITFAGRDERLTVPLVDLALDTRIDPAFPRNAVHIVARGEQLRLDDGRRVARWTSDARVFVGLVGSSVLALRASSVRASAPLPPYEQTLVGGASSVRGYEFGYRAGDNLAAAALELRMPLTSPLSVGRFGVKGFVDAATVYPAGGRLSDQTFDRGAGGGLFMTWTVLRAGIDVAWPLGTDRRKPRWHLGLGVTF